MTEGENGFGHLVEQLKAMAEPSRLRILLLMVGGELTVSELVWILGQSQPRISRHLRILAEAGLVDRLQEGSWAFFQLTEAGRRSVDAIPPGPWRIDPQALDDAQRLEAVKAARARRAADFFAANAAKWDELRSLHASDDGVERRLAELIGAGPHDAFLDIGTGTGRMLELFSATARRAIGIDASSEMLSFARDNLRQAAIDNAQVRLADLIRLPFGDDSFDLITIHQVLHYLPDPRPAIAEAARVLQPGGLLLIVDFVSHELEYLRADFAHARLGFSDEQMRSFLEGTGLSLEEISAIEPTGPDAVLTAKIWSIRDPRRLFAAGSSLMA